MQQSAAGVGGPAVAGSGGKRFWMTMIITFMTALLIGATPGLANAGNANSSVGAFTTAGVGYQNYATISTTTGSALAYTSTGPSSTTVASGWVGSRGRLFTSGGALSCEGANSYSNLSCCGDFGQRNWWFSTLPGLAVRKSSGLRLAGGSRGRSGACGCCRTPRCRR